MLIRREGYGDHLKHLSLVLALAALPVSAGWADSVRVYVTNSAGDSVHVIDPATNKVVQEIKGIEAAHGINFSPDGARVYISNEADSTLDVVERKGGKMIKKVPLSGHPNNIAVTKDGKRVVVAIAREPGSLDFIDTSALTRALTVPVNGRQHNVYVTPDGKTLWVTSLSANAVFVYSLPELKPVGHVALPELKLPGFKQPIGALPNWVTFTPDSKLIYVSNSGIRSVSAIDTGAMKVVANIPVGEVPKRINTLVMR